MKKIYTFLILLAALRASAAVELHLPATRINVTEGYSGNHIICINKDHFGFMWFGSDNGLYRYDGIKLVNLQNMEGVTGKLTDNSINDIAEDQKGNLWIQTRNALHRFNMQTGLLERYANVGCNGIPEPSPPNNVSCASDGTVWYVCTQKQILQQIVGKDSVSNEVKMASCQSDSLLREILNDGDECYIVGLTEARIVMKSKTGKLTIDFDHSALLKKGARVFFLQNLCVSHDGRYVEFGVNVQDVFNCDNNTGKKQLIKSKYEDKWPGIMEMEFDQNNTCWLGFHAEMPKRSFIVALNPLTGVVNSLDSTVREWIDARIRCFLPDEQNLFWMGTERGVVKLHITSSAFTNYLHRGFSNSSDYYYSARGLFQLNDSILLTSTYEGNFSLNLFSGTHGKKFGQQRIAYAFWRGPGGKIRFIDDTKGIWVYDSVKAECAFETSPEMPFRCLTPDKNGGIGIGSLGCLYKWNNGHLDSVGFTGASVADALIKCIQPQGDTALLLGTATGLFRFNTQTHLLTSLQHYWTEKQMIPPEINQCYLTKANQVWMATTAGLHHLNLAQGKLEIFGKAQGMANTTVVSMLPDADGNLWMGTYNGLSCFIPAQNKFRNFTVADGLPHSEFNYGSALKLQNGRLLFGTLNGLVAFYPKQVLTGSNAVNPAPVLTRLSVYDENKKAFVATETGLGNLDKIELNPFSRSFELDASLLNYADPQKHEFWYYLQNFDDTWIANGNKHTIRYTNLPAGNYRLLVKVQDERGQWSNELVIPVIVHEIFYRQAWFWLLCFFVFTALAYVLYRFRMAQLIKVHQVRMSIAADLHDEVGSMLTGIAFQAELAQAASANEQTSSLEKITGSLQTAVEKMRDVIWTVDAGKDNWGNLLAHMEDHLYSTFSSTDTSFKFHTEALNPKKEISAAARQHIFLIFKEAVNNIIKHSNATRVSVFIGNTTSGFEMRISDNGTVSETKFVSGGNGLINMQNRAKALQAEVEVNLNSGYEIILRRNKPF